MRLYNLPFEYKQAQSIFNIVRGVRLPLKVGPQTLNLDLRIYARVLVEVDLLHLIPKKVLVKRLNLQKQVEEDFFVEAKVEKLPKFRHACCVIIHDDTECRRIVNRFHQEGQGVRNPVGHNSMGGRNDMYGLQLQKLKQQGQRLVMYGLYHRMLRETTRSLRPTRA